MRSLFPGSFKNHEEDVVTAWQSSLFVLDTNILLSLYRYSDGTRRELFRLLSILKTRLWLPHRAAHEYLTNRLSVIDAQEKSYNETIKTIASLEQSLRSARQHPFVSEKTMEKISNVFTQLCTELEYNKEAHTKRIENDQIKESIADLFDGKVGPEYSNQRLEEIILEGERRFKEKTPPGYKDVSKATDGESLLERARKYGDLILWYQVIDQASAENRGIIFITDDRKDDWWERFKGKTIGPRPELVREFLDLTGSSFYMYQADRFLELARENLNEEISEESVEEIREVRRRDQIALQDRIAAEYGKRRKQEIDIHLAEEDMLKRKIASLEEERNRLHQHHAALQDRRDSLQINKNTSMGIFSREGYDTETLAHKLNQISEENALIQRELDIVANREHDLQAQLSIKEQELSEKIERLKFFRQRFSES